MGPPWVTRIHRPTPRRLSWSSAALIHLVRLVQANPTLTSGLDALAGSWTADAFVHGDLRMANILVRNAGAPAVVLVDWEAGGPGHAAADLGAVIGEILLGWAIHPVSPGQRAARSAFRLACHQIRALWTAYGDGVDADSAVRWGGARLVQTAAEACQHELFPPPSLDAMLHAAAFAFEDGGTLVRQMTSP